MKDKLGKQYRLFISHAWDHKDDYYRLCELLDSVPYFEYSDYSVPAHDPLTGALKPQFEEQIRQANVVVVLSGMYAYYSNWMQTEVRIAKKYNKPIIGIMPFGQEKVPEFIQEIADEMVHWNTDAIVAAIRKYSI